MPEDGRALTIVATKKVFGGLVTRVAGAVMRLDLLACASIALSFVVPAGPAQADCLLVGTTVICSGPSPLGFDAGVTDGLTVNVLPGAAVGTGITLNDNNVVSNLGGIAIGDFGTGIAAGSNNQINSSGSVTVGDGGAGIMVTGAGSVLNSGNVTVGIGGAGIFAPDITNTGTITVGDGAAGIVGTMDSGTLINRGTIVTGEAARGIFSAANGLTIISSGSISFGDCGIGIDAAAGQGHTILNSGSISGTGCGNVGIQAGDLSTVTNSGTIIVGETGAGIIGGLGATLLNSGSILAGPSGVGMLSSGNLTNTGSITVGDTEGFGGGMIGEGDNLRLVNTGTITGGVGTPGMITIGDNGVLINSGTITVGRAGGGMIGQGLNSIFLNSGTIMVGHDGIGIDAQRRDATVINTGTIIAGNAGLGIQAARLSAVANSGTIIIGNSGAGIVAGEGTSVFNGGRITAGTDGTGIAGRGNMVNTGTITVGDSTSFASGGMVGLADNLQLANTGTIAGGTGTPAMIVTGSNGLLGNSGTITVGAFGGGMVAQGGNASLGNGGQITVGTSGIGMAAQGAGSTLVNSGAIFAGDGGTGIQAAGLSTVISSGAISVGAGGTGIAVLGANTAVANSGSISTCGTGIDTSAAGGSVANSGTIAGNGCNATGVALGQGGTLVNSGLIATSTTAGLSTGGNATVTNSGTLNGMISLAGAGGNSLTNAGLITVSAPLAPGGGVAHFVDGTFTQTASGTFTTRISPNNAPGNYDTLGVGSSVAGTGVANLGGRLTPVIQPGLYGASTTYAGVLTFASSTGRFADLAPLSLFLNLSVVYNPTSVDLVMTRTPFNQLPGGGANARAVGNALEASYSTNLTGALAGFYGQLLLSTATNTLSQLTGEIATAPQNASFMMFGQFLGTLFGQAGSARPLGGGSGGGATTGTGAGTRVALAAASDNALPCTVEACDTTPATPRYTAWAQGFGTAASIDRSANIGNSRLDLSGGGGAAGIDMWLGSNALVGVTLGTASSGYSLTDLQSWGGARSILFGVYGGYTEGQAYVDGALGFAYNTFTTSRFIGTGSLSEVAYGSFDGYQYGGRVEGGWRFGLGRNVLTPFMGLTVQALTQPAYSETSRTAAGGAPGVLGITVQGQTSTSIRSVIGAQFETAITANDDTVFRPRLRLGWAHEFNVYRTVTATLGALLPNAPFTVMGAQPAPDALVVSAGFDLELSRMVRLYGQFDGDFSDNSRSFAGTGGVRLVW